MQARGYMYMMSVWALISGGCKKHYAPPAVTAEYNYLVVEGVISAGGDSTIVKLSRTIPVSAQNTVKRETGATVTSRVSNIKPAFWK